MRKPLAPEAFVAKCSQPAKRRPERPPEELQLRPPDLCRGSLSGIHSCAVGFLGIERLHLCASAQKLAKPYHTKQAWKKECNSSGLVNGFMHKGSGDPC